MPTKKMTGAEIRQSFIDFFKQRGHTVVPSASVVPGGDQTLLFTNAGMVQFKNIFLGEETRPYTRAVDSQKCMRVAGKHNDLDEVGRDDTHHTFFEMLGNWSFGDYYKKEAITWAWELLTEVWGLDKSRLWATCFKDEKGIISTDEEAYDIWTKQPGINPEHVVYFGRKDNFWEMADTGPCGPSSEIHIDYGPEFCDKKGVPGHICKVNGDCKRFMEIWNLVFIQYNRTGVDSLEPLPAKHVDTGMGFERIVSLLQNVHSNYQIDLFQPCIDEIQRLTGNSDQEKKDNFTPYRVIADHTRSAAFLIADGVIPGNTGRNYVCRMIIRRAARFGTKIGLNEPFMAKVAEKIIESYSSAYPELEKNRKSILDSITREEVRFQKTVEAGLTYLTELLEEVKQSGEHVLGGEAAFNLYATHGLPYELARDIAREQDLDVDEAGFKKAMDEHRIASGAGKALGQMGGEAVEFYRQVLDDLVTDGKISTKGVVYNPYSRTSVEGKVLSIIENGESVPSAPEGSQVAVILPEACFYIESGGQVGDQGVIITEKDCEVKILEVKKPAAGIIVHIGLVLHGTLNVGDQASAIVDLDRRNDIMRNHTATHLLHAQLRAVLGDHARQAGSLVAPDKLRFDFTHPQGMTESEIAEVEAGVNRAIHKNYLLGIVSKTLNDALAEGATALFGEKYEENVRTVRINDGDVTVSYELCGGTHVEKTGDIGMFLIVSEGSAAAGIRRIEAITGRAAYEHVAKQFHILRTSALQLECSTQEIPEKITNLQETADQLRKQIGEVRSEQASSQFSNMMDQVVTVNGISLLSGMMQGVDVDILQKCTDQFRNKVSTGVIVLGSIIDEKPLLVVAITDDLVKKGWNAGKIVKELSSYIDGGGGGKPSLARAGGKKPEGLREALNSVQALILKN